jgi:hypothetical protein
MFGREYQIISHSVDERQNKINLGFLELSDSFKTSLSSELSELSATLPEMTGNRGEPIHRALDMNLFVLREELPMSFGEPDESKSKEKQIGSSIQGGGPMIPVPAMGGQRIFTAGPGTSIWHPPSTIGMAGTFVYNGVLRNGIITAGHYLRTTGEDSLIYRNGVRFGQVRIVNWANGSWGDWAAVEITLSGVEITNRLQHPFNTPHTVPMTHAVFTFELPVGTFVSRYGSTSGFTLVEVTARNQDITFDGITIRGLTQAIISFGSSATGDSGGPYWEMHPTDMNQNAFHGIHTARVGNTVYYTPYMRFARHFTVKTTG